MAYNQNNWVLIFFLNFNFLHAKTRKLEAKYKLFARKRIPIYTLFWYGVGKWYRSLVKVPLKATCHYIAIPIIFFIFVFCIYIQLNFYDGAKKKPYPTKLSS